MRPALCLICQGEGTFIIVWPLHIKYVNIISCCVLYIIIATCHFNIKSPVLFSAPHPLKGSISVYTSLKRAWFLELYILEARQKKTVKDLQEKHYKSATLLFYDVKSQKLFESTKVLFGTRAYSVSVKNDQKVKVKKKTRHCFLENNYKKLLFWKWLPLTRRLPSSRCVLKWQSCEIRSGVQMSWVFVTQTIHCLNLRNRIGQCKILCPQNNICTDWAYGMGTMPNFVTIGPLKWSVYRTAYSSSMRHRSCYRRRHFDIINCPYLIKRLHTICCKALSPHFACFIVPGMTTTIPIFFLQVFLSYELFHAMDNLHNVFITSPPALSV